MMLVLILLTSLDGTPVWVESTHIDIIRGQQREQCRTGHNGAIRVGGRGLCVRETPEEILRLIKNAR